MTSRKLPPSVIAATIDVIGEDLLHNIVARLPATSFASAACVSRSWNLVCERLLSRPKLSSACSFSPSLQVAVEEVVNKVLSDPIRPHFAIVCVGLWVNVQVAHRLITARLSSKVPVVVSSSYGLIGRDVYSDELKEDPWRMGNDADRGIMLTIGFVPGVKAKIISLSERNWEDPCKIDKFITNIWKFSTSVSGRQSPAAIMIFCKNLPRMNAVMEKIDYAMAPETVIVGGGCHSLQHPNGSSRNISALALVFVEDMNKPPGVGETQFHTVLSSGLLPIGPTYMVKSCKKPPALLTGLTLRREGSHENLDGSIILNQVYEELGGPVILFIGVTKRRKCSIGQGKVKRVTSLAFHYAFKGDLERLIVDRIGIKKGDTFRFYRPDRTTALSSITNASNQLRSFKQGSTTGGKKQEVFGGFIFRARGRSGSFFRRQPKVDSSLFLDNFPGVTLGGTSCDGEIGRGDLTPYVKESQEQKSTRCCMHEWSAVYLIMSYTP